MHRIVIRSKKIHADDWPRYLLLGDAESLAACLIQIKDRTRKYPQLQMPFPCPTEPQQRVCNATALRTWQSALRIIVALLKAPGEAPIKSTGHYVSTSTMPDGGLEPKVSGKYRGSKPMRRMDRQRDRGHYTKMFGYGPIDCQ